MRLHLEIAAAAVCLALVAPARAQAQGRWKEIGKTSAGNPVYVDPGSIKTVNGIVHARIRVRFITPVDAPEGKWLSSQHAAMFDCAKSTLANKESTYYSDAAGTKVIKHTVNAKPGFGPALGGSMTQVALDYICKTRR
jgi:hypothetical protein